MDAHFQNTSEDLSPYQVHSRREILALLRILGEQRMLINMVTKRGEAAIVSSILEVNDQDNKLVVDCAQGDHINDQILQSDNIAFETMLDQIRILFFADQVEECQHDGAPALQIDLPKTVIRLQRREFYRVPTPLSNPASCTITIPQPPDGTSHAIRLVLQNVSGGGIALIDDHNILDGQIGKIYHQCSIDLPGGALIVASLELRNVQEIQLANGKRVHRIGCLFVDIPQSMLAAVQRYIAKLEREHNARGVGR